VARPLRDNPKNRTNAGVGLETILEQAIAFRTGVNWQETENKTLFAVGIGYRGPRLSIDYTFEKDTRVDEATRHLVDLWMPF
jgi:hypothetical protein